MTSSRAGKLRDRRFHPVMGMSTIGKSNSPCKYHRCTWGTGNRLVWLIKGGRINTGEAGSDCSRLCGSGKDANGSSAEGHRRPAKVKDSMIGFLFQK